MSRLRANSITNKGANGAPTATNGLEVTGVCTATDFSGQMVVCWQIFQMD